VEVGKRCLHELDRVAAGIALGFCCRNTGRGLERLVNISDSSAQVAAIMKII